MEDGGKSAKRTAEWLPEALRGVDRETLLAVLADVLAGPGKDYGDANANGNNSRGKGK